MSKFKLSTLSSKTLAPTPPVWWEIFSHNDDDKEEVMKCERAFSHTLLMYMHELLLFAEYVQGIEVSHHIASVGSYVQTDWWFGDNNWLIQ